MPPIYIAPDMDEPGGGKKFDVTGTELVSAVIKLAVDKFGWEKNYANWGLTRRLNLLGTQVCDKRLPISNYMTGDAPSFYMVDEVCFLHLPFSCYRILLCDSNTLQSIKELVHISLLFTSLHFL